MDYSYIDHMGPTHKDGTAHVPDWSTLAPADGFGPEFMVFDVWCSLCGQSGSIPIQPVFDELSWR